MLTHDREDWIPSAHSPARSSYNSNTRPRFPLFSSAHGRKIPMHEFSGLESRLQRCRLPRQKMLLWKLYRMAWTVHANADAPAPSWVVHPARNVPAPTTDRTHTSNGAGSQTAERRDRRHHNYNSRWSHRCEMEAERHVPMGGWGPIFWSILPKLDRTGAICDALAKQFRGCICHQTRKWHICSTELNICGERIVNWLRWRVSH